MFTLAHTRRSRVSQGSFLFAVLLSSAAHAQEVAPPAAPAPPAPAEPATPAPQPAAPALPSVKITPFGYVEGYFAYNFNRPSNGITNFRGFDNRHDSFTLSNAALGANLEAGPLGARIVMQIGSTPSTYYLGEPSLPGSGSVNASGPELWKYLQEAYVSYKAPVGRGLQFQLGLFASPIGYEVLAVKDNWNWSRSNLFFGLPFYHAGLRATYEWTNELSSTIAVFNGWNNVVDNNEEKSLQANVTYKLPDKLLVQLLYFGGIERSSGAPEGRYWRHHVDAIAQYDATPWLSVAGQADYGWEPNRFGTARWVAGALYARVKPMNRVYVALRGDRFHEHLATSSAGSSSPLFWGGVEWVSSTTATLDIRPHDQLSLRLEYRRDMADAPLFYGRHVQGDGSAANPYVASEDTQDTVLFGATAWF
ncbi:outer membrane beta-barrel protein [Pendulispora albinea]|uniref:Porin n=1 Tax=Pendulispora albinea TaxID=2741071 RepID=A0ABZ2LW06_9BACT